MKNVRKFLVFLFILFPIAGGVLFAFPGSLMYVIVSPSSIVPCVMTLHENTTLLALVEGCYLWGVVIAYLFVTIIIGLPCLVSIGEGVSYKQALIERADEFFSPSKINHV